MYRLPEYVLCAIGSISTTFLLLMQLFIIAALADFGYGHTRAEVCCAYSNKWIFIKGLGHALLASLMILNNQVVLAFINVPMLLWTCFYKAQVGIYGKEGIYDPTEIRSRLNLCRYMRDASLQLGFYVISFFAYAYFYVVAMQQKE